MKKTRLRFLHATLRQVVWTALVVLFSVGVGGAFPVGFSPVFTPDLAQSLLSSNVLERIAALDRALAAAQLIAILSLGAIAIALFCLAWFIRARMLDPLISLRGSVEGEAAKIRDGV